LTGDHIRACRHARELVADMHWRGLSVPPLYARMAAEFQDLVASGAYAAWVANGGAAQGAMVPGRPGPSALQGRGRRGETEGVELSRRNRR
jgi:hypothetical protein